MNCVTKDEFTETLILHSWISHSFRGKVCLSLKIEWNMWGLVYTCFWVGRVNFDTLEKIIKVENASCCLEH